MQFLLLADIAPDPTPGESLPAIVGGVCLSLAMVFFGLWMTNKMKMKKAADAASQGNPQELKESIASRG
ncbi:MAG TPA: hypothetical protein V6C76_00125 [Drouetiella sp.]